MILIHAFFINICNDLLHLQGDEHVAKMGVQMVVILIQWI